MSSFKVVTSFETINSAGSKKDQSWSFSKASLDDVTWSNVQVSAGARVFVWNPTSWLDFNPSAFAVLVMVADGDLDVEMGIQVGDADVEYNSFRVAKNVPFILGADDAYYNHSATTDAAFGGDLGAINSIRVDEPNTTAVNLTMAMGV